MFIKGQPQLLRSKMRKIVILLAIAFFVSGCAKLEQQEIVRSSHDARKQCMNLTSSGFSGLKPYSEPYRRITAAFLSVNDPSNGLSKDIMLRYEDSIYSGSLCDKMSSRLSESVSFVLIATIQQERKSYDFPIYMLARTSKGDDEKCIIDQNSLVPISAFSSLRGKKTVSIRGYFTELTDLDIASITRILDQVAEVVYLAKDYRAGVAAEVLSKITSESANLVNGEEQITLIESYGLEDSQEMYESVQIPIALVADSWVLDLFWDDKLVGAVELSFEQVPSLIATNESCQDSEGFVTLDYRDAASRRSFSNLQNELNEKLHDAQLELINAVVSPPSSQRKTANSDAFNRACNKASLALLDMDLNPNDTAFLLYRFLTSPGYFDNKLANHISKSFADGTCQDDYRERWRKLGYPAYTKSEIMN